MDDTQNKDFHCRQCGYSLRGLESTRCPECVREFDPASSRTMSRTPRRNAVLRWIRFTLITIPILLLVYMIAYLSLVEIGQTRYPSSFNIYSPPNQREVAYRFDRGWVQFIFLPANWLDRRVREDMWLDYDCEERYIGPRKTALKAMWSSDRALRLLGSGMRDRIMETRLYREPSVQWKAADVRVFELEAELKKALAAQH